MKCQTCRDIYRTRRHWWERLIGVKRADRCTACGHRRRFFSAARREASAEPRIASSR